MREASTLHYKGYLICVQCKHSDSAIGDNRWRANVHIARPGRDDQVRVRVDTRFRTEAEALDGGFFEGQQKIQRHKPVKKGKRLLSQLD